MSKQHYEVVNPLKCHGQRHEPGSSVELDSKVAEQLLSLGAIKSLQKPKGSQPAAGLMGSSKLPREIALPNGKVAKIGDVVRAAHEKSALSTDEWNALSVDDRDVRIELALEALKIANEPAADGKSEKKDEKKDDKSGGSKK